MGLEGVIIGIVVIVVIYLVVGVGGGYACRDADEWIQNTQTPWDVTWFKGGNIPQKLNKYSLNQWSTKGNPGSVCKIFNNGSPYNPLKWINPYSYCNEQRVATCQQRDDGNCNIDWQNPDNSWCKPAAWYSDKICTGKIAPVPGISDQGTCYGPVGASCTSSATQDTCTPPCKWYGNSADFPKTCEEVDENLCAILPGCSLKDAPSTNNGNTA